MTIENLKRLQSISHRTNRDKNQVAAQFVSTLRDELAKRGHRADLALTTDARSTAGRFTASVRFDATLGHPAEDDLVTLVAKSYPGHEIDWEMTEVDSDQGIVLISLTPAAECIPVKSVSEIPPEFKPIGSGLYKRAVDSTVSEIWTLKKGEDGLMLYRSQDDMEVTADKEGLKAGDIADTPYGPGRIIRFDDTGNAFVQIGNASRLVAAQELGMYDVKKEKKLLTDYFAEAYGDPTFAEQLTKDYTTRSKK
jgi:hypothetical protein